MNKNSFKLFFTVIELAQKALVSLSVYYLNMWEDITPAFSPCKSDWCLHTLVHCQFFCMCFLQMNLTLGTGDECWWMSDRMADDSRSGPSARWVREPGSVFPNNDIWFCLLLFLSLWQVQSRQSIGLSCSHLLRSPSLCLCLYSLPVCSLLILPPSSSPSPRSIILDFQRHLSVEN